jgi:hypothetical protein
VDQGYIIIPEDAVWRKPLRSVGQGACVEVTALPEHIAIRDSKDRSGPPLVIANAAWTALIDSCSFPGPPN